MTDLIKDWNNRKAAKNKSHKKFVKRLKQHRSKRLDQWGDQLHEQVFKEVDCLDCANCCTSIPPLVNKSDINRIAKHLGTKTADFKDKYITQDEDGDQVMNASPCPFLESDNKCQIYEVRPKACREYPHTNQQEFTKHLELHAINTQYCPAVFHILERMMASFPV